MSSRTWESPDKFKFHVPTLQVLPLRDFGGTGAEPHHKLFISIPSIFPAGMILLRFRCLMYRGNPQCNTSAQEPLAQEIRHEQADETLSAVAFASWPVTELARNMEKKATTLTETHASMSEIDG